ncbi:MAG TPA: DUF2723 domain-containing protein [Elusimicrobiota bacterium]|nr:DUF2723 domain-containing protein [Elusimicrobiota bacterium]
MKKIFPASLFLIFFGFYAYLSFPALSSFRDAGDFSAAALSFGVPHPPGYPSYVLLAKFFQPFLSGNPAYRANIVSAFCGAGVVLLVFLSLSRFCGLAASLLGALFIGFFSPHMAQSGLSEIYGLNALFAALLLWGAFFIPALSPSARTRGWVGLGLLGGMGMGNHQTLLAVGPSVLLLLWRERGSLVLHPRFVRVVLAAAGLGLAVYLLLPLRAAAEAVQVWGEPDTWNGFWAMFTRADYGTGTLSSLYSTASPAMGLAFWFRVWGRRWGAWAVVLQLAAAVWLFRKENRKVWGAPVLLLWIFSGPVFALLARLQPAEHSEAVLSPALVLPGLAAALGMGFFLEALLKRRRFLAVLGLLAVTLFVVGRGVPAVLSQRQRWNLVSMDYGRNLFRTVPPASVLLMISDTSVFSAAYSQAAGARSDVRLLVDASPSWRWRQYRRRFPDLFSAGQEDGGMELLRRQSGRVGLFTEGIQPKFVESLHPYGLAAAVEWPKRTPACLDRMEESLPLWGFYVRRLPSAAVLRADYYTRTLLKTVSSGGFNAGLLLHEGGRRESSLAFYARSLFWNPERILRWAEIF